MQRPGAVITHEPGAISRSQARWSLMQLVGEFGFCVEAKRINYFHFEKKKKDRVYGALLNVLLTPPLLSIPLYGLYHVARAGSAWFGPLFSGLLCMCPVTRVSSLIGAWDSPSPPHRRGCVFCAFGGMSPASLQTSEWPGFCCCDPQGCTCACLPALRAQGSWGRTAGLPPWIPLCGDCPASGA